MNLSRTLFGFLMLIFFSSCSVTSSTTYTYWVDSMKVDCDKGEKQMQCLRVTQNKDFGNPDWTLFYSDIEDFTFEPGMLQRIKVKESKFQRNGEKEETAERHYLLIETLEKIPDPRMPLHDIWAVTHVNSEKLNLEENRPNLEINLAQMTIFGSNGCNNFNGNIQLLNATLIQFGAIATTRKMCEDMTIPDGFDAALTKTHSYKKEKLNLTFYDNTGKELLRFQKVD